MMEVHECPGCGVKHYRMNMASRLFRGKIVCVKCSDVAIDIENEEYAAREKAKYAEIKRKLQKVQR